MSSADARVIEQDLEAPEGGSRRWSRPRRRSGRSCSRGRWPPGRTITVLPPVASGRKNSQTDTSKLNGCFCRKRSAEVTLLFAHAPEVVDDAKMLDFDALGRPVVPEVKIT